MLAVGIGSQAHVNHDLGRVFPVLVRYGIDNPEVQENRTRYNFSSQSAWNRFLVVVPIRVFTIDPEHIVRPPDRFDTGHLKAP